MQASYVGWVTLRQLLAKKNLSRILWKTLILSKTGLKSFLWEWESLQAWNRRPRKKVNDGLKNLVSSLCLGLIAKDRASRASPKADSASAWATWVDGRRSNREGRVQAIHKRFSFELQKIPFHPVIVIELWKRKYERSGNLLYQGLERSL